MLLSLPALVDLLAARVVPVRLEGGFTTGLGLTIASLTGFSTSLFLAPKGAKAPLGRLPKVVTSDKASLFLFTPVSFSFFVTSAWIDLAFEAAVDAVARVVTEVAVVPAPRADFARVARREGRATTAFSVSLLARRARVVLLTYCQTRIQVRVVSEVDDENYVQGWRT